MVYGLVYLVIRRNIKFSTKALQHAESLLHRRFPIQVLPNVFYSTDEKGSASEDSKKPEAKLTPSFSDGRSHINHIIEQAKRGKISVNDLTSLCQRVIAEAPYKNYSQAPQAVQYIGFAGLAPMLGIPVLTLLSGHALPCMVFAHLAFGATILSFLGGSNWYEAISKNDFSYEKLGWAVAPQAIGWLSLLPPLPIGMLFITSGFCLSLMHDVLLSSYPPWMKSLRLVLTAGTVLSFFLMLIFYTLLSHRSWSSGSRSRSDSRSRSASSSKKRSRSRSNSSKSYSRSRSVSRDKSKARRRSDSSSSRSTSPKRVESPPKAPVPRYYGRNRKDSSSSLSLDSSDTDSKANAGQPSSSSGRNNAKKNAIDEHSSGGRSAGNARPTSKPVHKERPQEKLKKKMQAMLNKQFRADKKAEKERMEKAEQERQDREAELRDIAIKIRRRERYLRHRGEDEENDGEREALRRRERYLRRSAEEDGKRGERREESKAGSSESGNSKSKSRSPESKWSRSPRRSSRKSRSPSPKGSRLGKRTLVDY